MDKSILLDYIDACELVKETEEDIKKLSKQEQVYDKVRGSNSDFPYQPKNFKVSGAIHIPLSGELLNKERALLLQRRDRAIKIKMQVEEIMNSTTPRIQRIIRYRVFQRLSWEEVADQMGGESTGESVRKEFKRFLNEK